MWRPIQVLGVALLLCLALPGAAAAGVPDTVDQGTLQPPLNPSFAYRCFLGGGGILCQGIYDPQWAAEDTGLTCGDRPIYTTGGGHERLSRWHLPDGRATRTIVQLHYDEAWSLSPVGAGQTVLVQGDWNRHYTYRDPGDRSTRVLTEVGSAWKVSATGYGVIARDAGLIRYFPGHDFEDPEIVHGPKDSWTGFDATIATVCKVLAR